jgi:hypothetical protein
MLQTRNDRSRRLDDTACYTEKIVYPLNIVPHARCSAMSSEMVSAPK